jgi:hypothetical protein
MTTSPSHDHLRLVGAGNNPDDEDEQRHLAAHEAGSATLVARPDCPECDPNDDGPAWEPPGRDDLDARMRLAIAGVAAWYAEARAANGADDSFYWGRQLYHVMRPVVALDRKLKGLPPEQPCTRCGTEEGGASSGPDGSGGRFSLCGYCAREVDDAS